MRGLLVMRGVVLVPGGVVHAGEVVEHLQHLLGGQQSVRVRVEDVEREDACSSKTG
jgi:hypothetical protein